MIINRNTETLNILDTDIYDVYFLAQSVNSSRDFFTKLGLNLCCPAKRQLTRNSQKADFGNFMFHLEDDWVDQKQSGSFYTKQKLTYCRMNVERQGTEQS